MTELTPDEFVSEVDQAIQRGYGFVPFVGAGFSAPSGVPLIVELEEYLRRCICIALGLDEKGPFQEESHQPWNPRTDRWPPFVDRGLRRARGHWERTLFDRIVGQRGAVQSASSGRGGFAEDFDRQRRAEGWLKIYSEGFGSMQDWRTALQFLSRLDPPARTNPPSGKNAGNQDCPVLGVPQPEVVDACFREVLKGRYPTLGHRMLGALAGALRIDVVLTTNFDNLLERAFEAARNPIEVFEVMLDGALPRRNEMESHRTLIKLHGGRVALRADYSLDSIPNSEDRSRFLSYLLSAGGRYRYGKWQARLHGSGAGPEVSAEHDAEGVAFEFDKHLLLLGFSASDRRINSLVREACDRLGSDSEEFRVYWIYFSQKDRDRLIEEFPDRRDKIRIVHSTSSGFLLLQLFQHLRGSLPPLGSIFPSASRLTLPPITPKDVVSEMSDQTEFAELVESIETSIWSEHDGSWAKVVVVYAEQGMEGLTSVCAEAFRKVETSTQIIPIWIDMNNVSSADNLFEVLLEAVHYRIGVEEWIPSTTESPLQSLPRYERRAREFARLLRSVDKNWVVFLNARECPGANAYEQYGSGEQKGRNGWLGGRAEGLEDGASAERFVELLVALCSEGSPHMDGESSGRGAPLKFVVMATGSEAAITQPGTWRAMRSEILPLRASIGVGLSPVEIATDCLIWTHLEGVGRHLVRRRFLHALVLMQRPRFPIAVWSPAFFDDRDPASPFPIERSQANDWLGDLEERRLVRRKPGGMIWVHSQVRGLLRERLRDEETAGIHVHLAAWYEKAIDASDAPDAVFEAAYHFCKAAEALCEPSRPQEGARADSDLDRAATLIGAATAKIRSESYLIQTHGYSRGSCRQLARLADIGQRIWDLRELGKCDSIRSNVSKDGQTRLRDSIEALWLASVEAMRAIAREVGEDGKAYLRQRQAAVLHLGGPQATWSFCDGISEDGPKKGSAKGLTAKMVEAQRLNYLSRTCLWRWIRWSIMLQVESRAYEEAEWMLHGHSFPDDRPHYVGVLGPLGEQEKYERILFREEERSEPIELLRLIEKAVEVQRLRFVSELRAGKPSMKRLASAEALARRGLRLAAHIRDSDLTSAASEATQASWVETRLLMHLSIIHSRAEIADFKPRLARNPLGILSEAEAKLRVSDSQRTRAELAIIDLHRAEVKLGSPELLHLDKSLRSVADGGFLEPNFGNASVESAVAILRVGGASASEAIRFLDRTEIVLRERRRNVYWTTWYFERKLKAIAYAVIASCSEEGSPIPFLGLEAAMRETDTEADRLLENAIRMIRLDAYRMVGVVRAYADCLLALVGRLSIDKTLPRLPLRLSSMHAKLAAAMVHAEELTKRSEGFRIDATVRCVIEGTQEKVRSDLASPHYTMLFRVASEAT